MLSENTVCYIKGRTVVKDKRWMYDVQTPTAIRYKALKEIVTHGDPQYGFSIAYMAQVLGIAPIGHIPGDSYNFKITYPADFEFFKMLKER
jgi:2-C-methyl-D-erythritol 4-phosphate cytidylyltransferase